MTEKEENTPIPFGTEVRVSGRYERITEGKRRYWRAIGFKGTGIVIGKRNLRNGIRNYEPYADYGGTYTFTPTEYFTAYLVAFPNCNPMYIPLDCIKERKV